jgi:uncharacterized protein
MQFQAENLRIYSLAMLHFPNDKSYGQAAGDIYKFLDTFLRSPDGAYFTSQDADHRPGEHAESYFKLNDKGRREKGIPRVDKNIYARENGWAITALCQYHAATGDAKVLAQAESAAQWILKNRSLKDGGYAHGDKNASIFLGDSIYMAQAFYSLFNVTGKREWLELTQKTLAYVHRSFQNLTEKKAAIGYLTEVPKVGVGFKPKPQKDENIAIARLAAAMQNLTGESVYKEMTDAAFSFLTVTDIAEKPPVAGLLLAAAERDTPPLHLTIVGPKGDSAAKALFAEALRYPTSHKRTEWWDPKEGAPLFQRVEYPKLKYAAAFVCSDSRCSLPITKPGELHSKVDRLLKSDGAGK